MKKILFLILAMLLPIVANADGDIGFAVGGINYEPLGGYGYTATVKGLTSDNSSSRIFIPASVVHNGDLYAVKAISSDAFKNNTNLVSVYISDGIKSIGASSFAGCTSLKCVRLPETLETIMAPGYSGQLGAFEGCTALKSIYLPESLNYQGEVDATAPHNICKWAFKNCTNLKTVVIAAQYPYIEDEAFINCSSLNYFVSNVTKLWNLENNTFQGIPTSTNLIVPDGLKSNYETTAGWNSFKNIYERSSYTTVFAIVTAGQGGKVALDSEDVSLGTQVWGITKGQNASFTITPNEGQKLKKLLKDGQDVTSSVSNGKYTVSNLQSDFTLEAVFEEGVPSQSEDKGTAKLSIESFDIKAGETKTMMIDMQNPEDQVTLVQFDLRLPSGLSIATGDEAIDIAGRTTWKKHTLTWNAVDEITRILLYSSTNAVIEGTSGAIISIKLVASSSFNGGDIKLENQLMTTPSLAESKPATYTYNIKGGGDNPQVGEIEPYVVYNDGVLTFYCDNQRSNRQGTTYDLTPGEWDWPKWKDINGSVTKVVFDPSFANARPKTTKGWFDDCMLLTEIQGISYLNTNEVTNMYAMFSNCRKLTSLDLSNFNTDKVTDMAWMFGFCESLTSLDMSKFNTENVTDMEYMFMYCRNLTSLDVSKFNTANVTTMGNMFSDCRNLTSLDLSSFDTNALKTDSPWAPIGAGGFAIVQMFDECRNLSKLILGSGFSTKEGIRCDEVFDNCYKLNTVVFTGDIPVSINSKFFEGVGTNDTPARLDVPEQFEANYAAKFNGNMFYGGYFTIKTYTGISVLSADNNPFDLYSISGAMVKKGATSLNALQKGVYIVNGRKVVVK